MAKTNVKRGVITAVKDAVNTYIYNPVILVPFMTTAFIQLLILELLYFAPRYPLNVFFGPIIKRFWGEMYLHYPFNLVILPKLFQFAQIPVYLLLTSFFVAVAVTLIAAINNDEKISFGEACKQSLSQYVHVVIGSLISFGVFYGLHTLYGLAIGRATEIRSTEGVFFLIKTVVLQGAPFFNLLFGVFVTALFAFMIPIIMIEKKKVFGAIIENFKLIWNQYFYLLFLTLIPSLFYLPVLLLRNNVPILADSLFPGVRLLVLILSVIVMIMIDATVYTAITTHYLIRKED